MILIRSPIAALGCGFRSILVCNPLFASRPFAVLRFSIKNRKSKFKNYSVFRGSRSSRMCRSTLPLRKEFASIRVHLDVSLANGDRELVERFAVEGFQSKIKNVLSAICVVIRSDLAVGATNKPSSWDGNYNLADLFARLHVTMCFDHLVEGKCARDRRL